MKKINSKNDPKVFIEILIIILSGIFSLFFLAGIKSASLKSTLSFISVILYQPHFNICVSGSILDVPINIWIYFLIFLTSIVLLIFRGLWKKWIDREYMESNPATFTAGVIFLILMIVMQSFGQWSYFLDEYSAVANKSMEEKFLSTYGPAYQFVKLCKEHVSVKNNGYLLTDIKTPTAPALFNKFLISYFLYPSINIRFSLDKPFNADLKLGEYLVVYKKNNPLESIPKNFRIISVFDSSSLLAIKEGENAIP